MFKITFLDCDFHVAMKVMLDKDVLKCHLNRKGKNSQSHFNRFCRFRNRIKLRGVLNLTKVMLLRHDFFLDFQWFCC